jgi:hypothetical protein
VSLDLSGQVAECGLERTQERAQEAKDSVPPDTEPSALHLRYVGGVDGDASGELLLRDAPGSPACAITHRSEQRVALASWTNYSPPMPHVLIDGVTIEARRLMLAPADVARVLRVEESDVRNMVRRGELRDVSSDGRRRLDSEEVVALVEQRVSDGELGRHVFVELAALISGRL